jgi:hypothetical protein
MNFPSEKLTNAPGEASRRSSQQEPYPAIDLSLLRRELYSLKDEIQDAVEKLRTYRSCLPPSASSLASDIVGSYCSLSNAVSRALTNHASEWIEADLSGGPEAPLSYAEFCTLDPSSIQDFSQRIHHIFEVLDIERDPEVQARWTRDMIQSHRSQMLLGEGQLDALDALESVAAVLTAMLIPGRS